MFMKGLERRHGRAFGQSERWLRGITHSTAAKACALKLSASEPLIPQLVADPACVWIFAGERQLKSSFKFGPLCA
jgi:hypothetical protein